MPSLPAPWRYICRSRRSGFGPRGERQLSGPGRPLNRGLSARAALKARDGRVPSTSYAALLVRDRCGCPARGKRAQTVTVGANSLVY